MGCLSCRLFFYGSCLLHGINKKMPSCFPFEDKRGCYMDLFSDKPAFIFKESLLQAIKPAGYIPMGFLFAKTKEGK